MKRGNIFHVVQRGDEYSVQGNQANEPCLHLGVVPFADADRVRLAIELAWANIERTVPEVPFEVAERVTHAIERAWLRDEAWRDGSVDNRVTQ